MLAQIMNFNVLRVIWQRSKRNHKENLVVEFLQSVYLELYFGTVILGTGLGISMMLVLYYVNDA